MVSNCCQAQLNLNDLPKADCAEFTQWFSDVAPHSTVMIFPAAYLNSPSSMFGHTLLRIDQADVQSNKTALLSYAINFGAYIEGSDNSILYAWKGLAGGYPGLFALLLPIIGWQGCFIFAAIPAIVIAIMARKLKENCVDDSVSAPKRRTSGSIATRRKAGRG